MSYITISKAAEILGVSKKTLFRWDEEGRFKPAKREMVSKIRLYDEREVKILKAVLDHEERFQNNLREFKKIQLELSKHMSVFLLSEKEIELQNKAEELYDFHKNLVQEFNLAPPEVKIMHKRFFKL